MRLKGVGLLPSARGPLISRCPPAENFNLVPIFFVFSHPFVSDMTIWPSFKDYQRQRNRDRHYCCLHGGPPGTIAHVDLSPNEETIISRILLPPTIHASKELRSGITMPNESEV